MLTNKEINQAIQEVESQPAESVTEYLQNEFVETPPAIQKQIDEISTKEGK